MKSFKRLSASQRVELTRWLDKNPTVCDLLTDDQAATKASKELGFTIATTAFAAQRRAQFPNTVRQHKGGWMRKYEILEERLTAIEKFLTTPERQRPLNFVPAASSDIKLSVV